MRTVSVELGVRSYAIHIGPQMLARADLLQAAIDGRQVAIVTNETVGGLYLDSLRGSLSDYDVSVISLSDGEQFKTLASFETIISRLLEGRFERGGTLVALGGGVIGDITGFAAACYQRGVAYVQIPTTLLAQVDSSVGGKTAVNHPLGKNMIGSFYQPRCVLADTSVLTTLPEREYKAGLAEIIKYGLIRDPEFFKWLEAHIDAVLAQDADALQFVVARSCENKAAVVADDERETGLRAVLNLGHSFGHAVEVSLGYGNWLHGEAVAAGLCMAGDLSVRIGWLAESEQQRIVSLIQRVGLPTELPAEVSAEQLAKHMQLDKKARAGKVRLILLKAIGTAEISSDYADTALAQTLAECRATA